MRKHRFGFTLLELMVVVAIIGILLTTAIQSYRSHIIAVRRTDATIALVNAQASLERYYAENNTYVGATLGTGSNATDMLSRPTSEKTPVCADGSAPSSEQYYCVSFTTQTASGFTLQAAPRSGTTQTEDTICGTFSLTGQGVKSESGSGDVATCWKE